MFIDDRSCLIRYISFHIIVSSPSSPWRCISIIASERKEEIDDIVARGWNEMKRNAPGILPFLTRPPWHSHNHEATSIILHNNRVLHCTALHSSHSFFVRSASDSTFFTRKI
mmetsp:Transcript_2707/g.5835  ORF Transcript_2707/g.5835 Transcript_2707/m.5835 type:complete len:112 (-) Transcript_2707:646-981(-)